MVELRTAAPASHAPHTSLEDQLRFGTGIMGVTFSEPATPGPFCGLRRNVTHLWSRLQVTTLTRYRLVGGSHR